MIITMTMMMRMMRRMMMTRMMRRRKMVRMMAGLKVAMHWEGRLLIVLIKS